MKNETLKKLLDKECEATYDLYSITADEMFLRPAIQKFWDKWGEHVSISFLVFLERENYNAERRLILKIFKEKINEL